MGDRAPDLTESGSRVWHLRSGSIDELVRAADQWDAWDRLSAYPAECFGLLLSAEPDESGDPVLVRTSHAMVRWGRMDDAERFAAAATDIGLPNTLAEDIANVEKARHRDA